MSDVSFVLDSGEITGRSWGDPAAPLVLCLPGFSQDQSSYDALGPALAATHHVVALALRGRGRSVAAEGAPWGARSHAKDVLDIAARLTTQPFTLVGWSFGGLVSMHVAALNAGAVARIVLIDVAGTPDPSTGAAVSNNQTRLSTTFTSPQEYVEHVLGSGMFEGAEEFYRERLPDDLVAVDGGFRTRTTAAIAEDARVMDLSALDQLWAHLTMPVLLLRATRPVVPHAGHIVPESERDRFLAAVPTARAVEIEANHAAIGVVPESVIAVQRFLIEAVPERVGAND